MAFHPLRTFQKHRKVFLAAITIVAMITFILTGSSMTGRGDFFSFLADLVGRDPGRATRVATLYGKNIQEVDVVRMRQRRIRANTFMLGAVDLAHQNIEKKLREASAKWEQFTQREINDALEGSMRRTLLARNPQLAAQFFGMMTPKEMQQQISGTIRRLQSVMQDFTQTGKTDEARLLGSYLAGLQQESMLLQQRSGREWFYFGGTDRTESILDFMIWLKQ